MENNRWFQVTGPGRNNIANASNEVRGNSTNGATQSQTLADIPIHQACKYIRAHGICEIYQNHINNGDVQAAMQAVSTFAYQEGISSRVAYPLILQCCEDNSSPCPPNDNSPFYTTDNFCNSDYCVDGQGNPLPNAHPDCICCPGDGVEIPCEGFWPTVQQQQGYCQKWAQAQASGNALQIQSEITNLATAFNITNAQAESIFMRCCPGSGSEPCPPNPNSPFYTTDNFCNSDWCVDGQGNPSPNAHPDCVCCPGDNIDVSPWCPEYVIAVDNADLTAMQIIITTVSNTFNIPWQQASQLLYDECICPNGNTSSGPCPPTNPNSPFYTNAGEFCPQCSPTGYYYGHVDCRCCDENNTAGPCDGFVDNGCCNKCDAANGDPTTNNMGGLPLMGPNHSCSQFCDQYGSTCCPTNTNQGGGGGTGDRNPIATPQARIGSSDNPLGLGSMGKLPTNFSGNGEFMFGDY